MSSDEEIEQGTNEPNVVEEKVDEREKEWTFVVNRSWLYGYYFIVSGCL